MAVFIRLLVIARTCRILNVCLLSLADELVCCVWLSATVPLFHGMGVTWRKMGACVLNKADILRRLTGPQNPLSLEFCERCAPTTLVKLVRHANSVEGIHGTDVMPVA
jgi:hypothetical protein